MTSEAEPYGAAAPGATEALRLAERYADAVLGVALAPLGGSHDAHAVEQRDRQPSRQRENPRPGGGTERVYAA